MLSQAREIDQGDSLPVILGQPLDHGTEAAGQFRTELARLVG